MPAAAPCGGRRRGPRSGDQHVSSSAGKRGQPGLHVYSAAKFGLVGFTEACNRDYGQGGIRSAVFCPGLVDTPLAAALRRAAR